MSGSVIVAHTPTIVVASVGAMQDAGRVRHPGHGGRAVRGANLPFFCKFLAKFRSFSAVSASIFVSKNAFFSIIFRSTRLSS